jgi:hypothetical protein
VERILSVLGPVLNGRQGEPAPSDTRLIQGWRQMLTQEQVQGMIIVVAHLPST